jgi:hypothetical protein
MKVGLRVDLPSKDAQRREIRPGRDRLIVSLSCAACSLNQYDPNALTGPQSFDRAVVVFDSVIEDVPKDFRENDKLQIVCYPNIDALPSELILAPPQIAVLAADGKVSHVPGANETLISFAQAIKRSL